MWATDIPRTFRSMRRGRRSSATAPLRPVMTTGRNECIRVTARGAVGVALHGVVWCGAPSFKVTGATTQPTLEEGRGVIHDLVGKGNEKRKQQRLVQGMTVCQ